MPSPETSRGLPKHLPPAFSMDVTIVYAGKAKKVAVSLVETVADAVQKAGINPQMVLIRRGRQIVPDTTKVADGDRFEAIRVVSGG